MQSKIAGLPVDDDIEFSFIREPLLDIVEKAKQDVGFERPAE